MKQIWIAAILWGVTAHGAEDLGMSLDRDIFREVEFVPHESARPYGSYLAMNIYFPPVKAFFELLDRRLSGQLNKENARTEAHITVITPPEYDFVLSEKLSIQEIGKIAEEEQIQSSVFKVICLGKAEAVVNQSLEQTYYLVVQAPWLVRIRQKIFDEFKRRGGNVSQFDPHLFYPHITIGYTQDDLHLGPHGVKKGEQSCLFKVSMTD